MFKPTYLYIKTHNVTGLKYFGQTTKVDPVTYRGSGTRWTRHIRKHGYDVTTEIVGYHNNEDECKAAALRFSIEFDIVKSNKWANIIPESLQGGADAGLLGFQARIINFALDPSKKEDFSRKLSATLREKYANGFENNCHTDNPMSNVSSYSKRQNSLKETKHQQGKKNSQFGSRWITNEQKNKKIKKLDPLPEGWRNGRISVI